MLTSIIQSSLEMTFLLYATVRLHGEFEPWITLVRAILDVTISDKAASNPRGDLW
jgi:3-methyladenine DNA glycosylase/8-oxoguanine DNA glycosylase